MDTIIIDITVKEIPKERHYPYPKVTHPRWQDAAELFEIKTGKKPKVIYNLETESHKFEQWLIPIEEEGEG